MVFGEKFLLIVYGCLVSNVLRNIGIACAAVLTLYGCWRVGRYFLVSSAPECVITGIQDGGQYAGKTPFTVSGASAYKVGNINVWFDEKKIVDEASIGSRHFQFKGEIDTKIVADGQHAVRIELVDCSYHHNSCVKQFNLTVDNSPLQAVFTQPGATFNVHQGTTLHLKVHTNRVLKKALARVFSKDFCGVPERDGSLNYEFFIPIDCDELAGEYSLSVILDDHFGNHVQLDGKIHVVAFNFKKQVLHHIDPNLFEEQKKLGKDGFQELMAKCAKNSPCKKLWRGAFIVPLNMTKITCAFGTERMSQERGQYRHAALDLIGALKSIIWAPQDGVVVIKDRFKIGGNCVVIDHGCAVLTSLGHLDSFSDIRVGDTIKRGAPVGIMGKTGYATGAHLHWEMRVNDVRVDPMQWTQQTF